MALARYGARHSYRPRAAFWKAARHRLGTRSRNPRSVKCITWGGQLRYWTVEIVCSTVMVALNVPLLFFHSYPSITPR